MTSQGQGPPEPVDLGKHGSDAAGDPPEPDLDFDPYRFGLPDQPVPPEYAPPGYRPPQPPAPETPYSPYGPASPYGPGPQGSGPTHGPGSHPRSGTAGSVSAAAGLLRRPAAALWLSTGRRLRLPRLRPTTAAAAGERGRPSAPLVCGILSIVLCWFAFFDAALVIPALVLGITVLSNRQAAGRGMAIAGVICAVIGAILAIVLTVVYVHIERDCRGVSSSQQQQCFRDKF